MSSLITTHIQRNVTNLVIDRKLRLQLNHSYEVTNFDDDVGPTYLVCLVSDLAQDMANLT